ncbi:MAG: hypothetical protein ACK58N_10485 [Synechocystis sp.]
MKESLANQETDSEIDLLAELSCAVRCAIEIRVIQIREFDFKLQDLKPQMPKGLEYMEEEFVKDYSNNTINRLRLSLICGTICYIIFGLIDPISLPSNYLFAWIIRYGNVLIFLIIIVFIFTNTDKRYTQPVSCLSTVLAGFGIIGMIGVSVQGEIGYTNYYSGVFLVILWANTTTCLRFIYSAISSFLIVIGYWGVAIIYQNVLQNQDTWNYFVTNNFFLVSGVLLSLVASFAVERQARLEFLARTIIVPGAIQEFHRYCESLIPIDRRQLEDFLIQNPRPQNLEIFVNKYKRFFLQ